MSIVSRSNYFITSVPGPLNQCLAFGADSTAIVQLANLFDTPLAVVQPTRGVDSRDSQELQKIDPSKGRLYCLRHALINIPLELIKTVAHVVAIPLLLLAALPLGLIKRDARLSLNCLLICALAIPGLVIRPYRFVADEIKLLIGIINPSLAIGEGATGCRKFTETI